MTKLGKQARERSQVVMDEYAAAYAKLVQRAEHPKTGDIALLHSCLEVLGLTYEDFERAAAAEPVGQPHPVETAERFAEAAKPTRAKRGKRGR